MNIQTTISVLLLVVTSGLTHAAEPEAPVTKPVDNAITVAVLDFAAKDITEDELGANIAETVTIMMTGKPGFQLVDRISLAKTLAEQELNLTGLVDTQQAVQVGKLVGARIIVVGKAFQLGKNIFITAKLIGTETTLVDGVLVKGDPTSAIDEMVLELAVQVADKLSQVGPKLVASDQPIDPVPALKEKLAGRELPTIAVVIPEEHIASRPPAQGPAPDPAVETEIKRLLLECGVPVIDVGRNALADWAGQADATAINTWPHDLAGADIVIVGEGFSEFASRLGNLVSCAARAEINMIDRRDGKVLLAQRITTRSVDLAEEIAGKKALQKAGRALGIKILETIAQSIAPQAEQPGTNP